jgi:4-alpha-glucanotransferase
MVEGELGRLAGMHGVSLDYWDQSGNYHEIDAETVVAVLGALGVPANTEDEIRESIRQRELRDWRRTLPPVFVHRQSQVGRVWAHVPHGEELRLSIHTETGQEVPVTQVEHLVAPQQVDGRLIGEAMFEIPAGLPTGWHELRASFDSGAAASPLVVVPDRLPEVAREWGPMVQVYSMRSRESWGMGDLGDLTQLADMAGRDWGAGFILVNPMHASGPTAPIEPSPYLPATRRFASPLYLRVEQIPEYADLSDVDRRRVDALAASVRPMNTSPDLLDRDALWGAKSAALEIIYATPRTALRETEFRAYVGGEGVGLQDFALWCALCEKHGPDWHEWPEELLDVRSGAVTVEFAELEGRVEYHSWLQWQLDQQFAATQAAARSAGMSIGIMHDLAVGVHGKGADSWRLRTMLAADVTVGAPPDMYNQMGQDWAQPPWHPDALAEAAFIPYRDMLREILRHAGGLRVDHILGLYRQWWIPDGMKPFQGTYVAVEHDAMVGILMLEASRVGAMLIGEDLGTVEDWIRDDMLSRGILGTGVLWFQRGADHVDPPEAWRRDELLSVTVHDLPPTAGYIAGEHIRVRADLGLLTRDPADEWSEHDGELGLWRAQLRQRGLYDDASSVDDEVVGLYRLAAASPARLLGVNMPDLTGDRRIQNQPGTDREYPNWSVPLGDADGAAVLLDDLRDSPLVHRIVDSVRGSR